MEVFIDEGGLFIPSSGWSAVCSLALPSMEVGPTRRKLAFLTRDWPKAPTGELKGGSLDVNHLKALVDLLFTREALLCAVAIDMAAEIDEGLENHRQRQCELITSYLTPEHHVSLVAQFWALRRVLERMPIQLYVQSVLMRKLTSIAIEQIAMYFAQRRPRELSEFRWTIDAKDPRRITTQEKWWRDTLGPFQEAGSMKAPLRRVHDPDFDYRFFNKAYEFEKEMCYPDRPRELVKGYDIGKILCDQISFKDSRSDILLQAIDILTNSLRRVLIGRIKDQSVAHALGRLQIHQSPAKGVYQSIHLMTLTGEARSEHAHLGRLLRRMSLAGRSMIRHGKMRMI